MPFVGILALAINRLRSRLGLTLLSLLGVALVVALAASIPIFTQAVSFTVMLDELNELAQITKRPPFAIRLYVVASERQPLPLATARDFVPLVTQTMSERLGLLPKNVTLSVETFSLSFRPVPGDETYGANVEELQEVILAIYPGIEEHIVISEGEPYGEITQGERLAVWVHDVMAEAMGLRVGEAYDVLDKGTGYLFPVYIAGFWHARAYPDEYWYDNPASVLSKALLMTPATFTAKVEPYLPEATGLVTWYLVFSEETIDTRRVERIADGIRQAANLLSMHMPGLRMDYSPLQPIERYFQRKTTLLALLVGFSLPAFGLLLYFMTLISAVTVTFQREEMAILSSRGVGRQPLSVTAFVETLLLLVAGTPVGLIGGLIIARLMGNTKSFLTFTVRPPLPVSFYGIDGRLLAGVLLALLVARLLPTWRAASTSIVGHLTERSRQVSGSLWPKLAVDLPLLLTCFYTYQRLKVRGSFGIVGWEPSGDPFRDPLLLLTPTLFVFTVCLVATHLFPLCPSPG